MTNFAISSGITHGNWMCSSLNTYWGCSSDLNEKRALFDWWRCSEAKLSNVCDWEQSEWCLDLKYVRSHFLKWKMYFYLVYFVSFKSIDKSSKAYIYKDKFIKTLDKLTWMISWFKRSSKHDANKINFIP